MVEHSWSLLEYKSLFNFCNYLYLSGYYSYLIIVGFGFSEDVESSVALFDLCWWGCAKDRVFLRETLLKKGIIWVGIHKNSCANL